MKIRVHVTIDHINAGLRADCKKCPVALALGEILDIEDFAVGDYDVYLENCRLRVFLPFAVGKFIQDFDSHKLVKPFSFTLEVPDGIRLKGVSNATT